MASRRELKKLLKTKRVKKKQIDIAIGMQMKNHGKTYEEARKQVLGWVSELLQTPTSTGRMSSKPALIGLRPPA